MYYIPYNRNLKAFSRQLRNNSTLSEVLLWQELRAGQLEGFKFNRQKPLGNYIVDFYCKKLSLVIEIDGESHFHDEAPFADAKRQAVLESLGFKFLRFDDLDVKHNMPQVLGEILHFIDEHSPTNPPSPLSKGGFSGSLKRKTGAGQRRLDQSSLPENTRRRHLYSFA